MRYTRNLGYRIVQSPKFCKSMHIFPSTHCSWWSMQKAEKKRYLCPRVTGVRFISRLVSIPHMDTDLYVRMYTPTHRIEAWLNAASLARR